MIVLDEDHREESSSVEEPGEDDEDRYNRPRWLSIVKDSVDVLLKLVLIGAAAFGYLEYLERQDGTRVRFALSIVDDWEEQNFDREFQNFSKFATTLLKSGAETFPQDKLAGIRYASNQFDRLYEGKIILTNNGKVVEREEAGDVDPQLKQSVSRLIYFYGKAGLCTHDEICDRDLMKGYFQKSSCDFYSLIREYVTRYRYQNGDPSFAFYVEYFCTEV